MAKSILEVIFKARSKEFERGVENVQRKLDGFSRSTTNVGKSLSKNVSVPLLAAGTMAVRQAMKFEKLETQLRVLTGSADEGSRSFERLKKMSAQTPFQLEELASVNNQLLGFGLNTDQAAGSLKMLGDIAALTGAPLSNIGVAFGQSAAAGRVMGQDLMQFINNGVPILQLLGDEMGVSASQIKEMASEGKIGFDELVRAMQRATGEGGMFEDGMGQMSETMGGKLSTAMDNFNLAMGEFGKMLVEEFDLPGVLDSITAGLRKMTEKIKDMSPAMRKWGAIFMGIFTAAGPILTVVGTAFAVVSKSIGLLMGPLKTILPSLGQLRNLFTIILNPITAIAAALGAAILKFTEFVNVTTPAVSTVKAIWNQFKNFGGAASAAGSTAGFLADQVKSQSEAMTEASEKIGETTEATSNLNDELSEPVTKMGEMNTNLAKMGESARSSASMIGGLVGQITELRKSQRQQEEQKQMESQFSLGAGLSVDFHGAMVKPVDEMNKGLAASLATTNQVLAEGVEPIKETISKELVATSQMINSVIESGVESMAAGLGEAFGAAMAGTGQLGNDLSKVLLTGVGNMAVQLGKLAIGVGVSIEGIKKALQSLNPVAAVAAGIALVALGSFAKNRAAQIGQGGGGGGKVAKFASGGIVSGPTLGLMGEYAGAKSNPEVIAPLDKLKGMMGAQQQQNVNVGGSFRVEGQDLVLALQRAERERNRIK